VAFLNTPVENTIGEQNEINKILHYQSHPNFDLQPTPYLLMGFSP
jgi:hypothetical protein